MTRLVEWFGLLMFVICTAFETVVSAVNRYARRLKRWLRPRLCRCCEPEIRFVFRISGIQETVGDVRRTPQYQTTIPHGATVIMQMNTLQQVALSVAPKDRKGNPAAVEAPEWLTDNSDVLSLNPSADGLSCLVVATGIPGSGNIIFRCDGIVGEGENPIQSEPFGIDVVSAPATTVAINAGTVEDQPD